MEKQYKLTDRVSKDSLKSPTFKKWVKRVLCFACILSLALQLAMCVAPMSASAEESLIGTWVINSSVNYNGITQTTYNVDFTCPNSSNPTRIYHGIKFYMTSNVWYTQYLFDNSFVQVGQFGTISSPSYTTIVITGGSDVTNSGLSTWLNANGTKVVTTVYDFTGEYRLFNEQLTNLSFAQSGTVTQTYHFNYQIWNGYSADYFTVQASGSQVDISYAFTDEGSGGVTTVYRQLLRNGQNVGTWLVPRARLIYFESNPDDPTFQQWLLDNTVLVDESMLQTVYDFGYNNGFNDGWTDNLIGDTLNAPIQALNNITLLQVGNTVITLGGVIFTMIVLCILIVFLKKFAGG